MDKEYIINRFEKLLTYLPKRVSLNLSSLPDTLKYKAEEIRLRAGRPIAITVLGEQLFVQHGKATEFPLENPELLTLSDMEQTFLNICGGSVYSHTEELCEGYIILPSGHRAGVCGTTVLKDGKITSQRDISSINIRIAKEINVNCDRILKDLNCGILVCGPPGSGKTTLIRNIVRSLCNGSLGKCYKVAVVDSRGEIGGVVKGVPSADLGFSADIITACPKHKGIEIALRTLFPDFIVFDELGSDSEVQKIIASMNSGVKIITTAHIGAKEDLFKRRQTRALINSGAIERIVFCHRDKTFEYNLLCPEKGLLCEL